MSHRNFIVSRAEAGRTVAEYLRARLGLQPGDVRRMVGAGLVQLGKSPCLDSNLRLRRGQRLAIRPPQRGQSKGKQAKPLRQPDESKRRPDRDVPRSTLPAPRGPRPIIRFADAHVVVVDKPAGLTTMRHAEEAAEFGQRGRRFLPPTLADLLPEMLAQGERGPRKPVRAVHRLDKETSGLVVFARTVEAGSNLGGQFRAHALERVYRALVRGHAREGHIESWLVRDRGDGRRGSSTTLGEGKRAVTHVHVVEELGEYTLVECRLETGRTHQVRIHLGEAGTPLCGDHVYDRPPHGKPLPDASGARRATLHAAFLAFNHPATGKRMSWAAPLPRDMADLLKRLRRKVRRENKPSPTA
jgi:23S rRNA pseudouridine1911/1915/1917 synthase